MKHYLFTLSSKGTKKCFVNTFLNIRLPNKSTIDNCDKFRKSFVILQEKVEQIVDKFVEDQQKITHS